MQGLPSGFGVCVSNYAGQGWRINLGGGKVYESADAAKVAALKDSVRRARRASKMYACLLYTSHDGFNRTAGVSERDPKGQRRYGSEYERNPYEEKRGLDAIPDHVAEQENRSELLEYPEARVPSAGMVCVGVKQSGIQNLHEYGPDRPR